MFETILLNGSQHYVLLMLLLFYKIRVIIKALFLKN